MKWPREHILAPTRFSAHEVVAAIRAGCRTRQSLRRFVRSRRVAKAPEVLNAGEAAWALIMDRRWIAAGLKNGAIHAERGTTGSEGYSRLIDRGEIEQLASEIDEQLDPGRQQ